MQARTAVATERVAQFDTDTDWIGVDNRCTGCISHVKSDFDGPLMQSHRIVKGFGGARVTNVKVGTLRWTWDDNSGQQHTFDIPNSYYIPDGKVRLLSPQHWAQTQNGNNRDKLKDNCGERTNARQCTLYWNDGKNQLHIPLGRKDNVATFPMSPGYKLFAAFCCEAGMDTDSVEEPLAMPAGIISNDEDFDNDDVNPDPPPTVAHHWAPPTAAPTHDASPQQTPLETDFNLNGPSITDSEGGKMPATTPNVIIDEENRQPGNEMAQLLMAHHQYGHASMRKLQTMAAQGVLPKHLAKCRIPVCSACLYAKATRKPWRGKPRLANDESDERPIKPGQVVSVDQLVSPTPGLIAQMTGFLTTKRYKYATVYVDQFSRIGFVHLQKNCIR